MVYVITFWRKSLFMLNSLLDQWFSTFSTQRPSIVPHSIPNTLLFKTFKVLMHMKCINHDSFYAAPLEVCGSFVGNHCSRDDYLHLHLSDAFIQSDLHFIQVSTFYQLLLSLGIEPMILALLVPCSTSWATGKLKLFKSNDRVPYKIQHLATMVYLFVKSLAFELNTCYHITWEEC